MLAKMINKVDGNFFLKPINVFFNSKFTPVTLSQPGFHPTDKKLLCRLQKILRLPTAVCFWLVLYDQLC